MSVNLTIVYNSLFHEDEINVTHEQWTLVHDNFYEVIQINNIS